MDPFSVALIRYRRRTPGLMFRLKIRCLWFVTVLEKARGRLRRLRLFKTIKARRRPINDRVTVAAWCSSVHRLRLFGTIKARRRPKIDRVTVAAWWSSVHLLRLFGTIKARRRPINDRVTVAAWCSSVRRLQLFKTIKARRSPNRRRRRTWRRPGCPPGNGPRKDWVRVKRIVESTKYRCAGSIYFLDGGFSFGVAVH